MQRSVRENIALPFTAPFRSWGPIDARAERTTGRRRRSNGSRSTPAPQGEVRRLSGGNQQKVTIARWVAGGVRTMLCFDPTRGHRHRDQAADLRSCCATSRKRVRRSSSTPRSSRRSSSPATGRSSSSAGGSSPRSRSRMPTSRRSSAPPTTCRPMPPMPEEVAATELAAEARRRAVDGRGDGMSAAATVVGGGSTAAPPVERLQRAARRNALDARPRRRPRGDARVHEAHPAELRPRPDPGSGDRGPAGRVRRDRPGDHRHLRRDRPVGRLDDVADGRHGGGPARRPGRRRRPSSSCSASWRSGSWSAPINGSLIVVTRVPDIVVTLAMSFVWAGNDPARPGHAGRRLRVLAPGARQRVVPERVGPAGVPRCSRSSCSSSGCPCGGRCSACPCTPWGAAGWRRSGAASRSAGRRSRPTRSAGCSARSAGWRSPRATGSGSPVPGPYTLQSVAAIVLGGVSLAGGRGGVVGPIVACVILQLVRTDLTLLGVESQPVDGHPGVDPHLGGAGRQRHLDATSAAMTGCCRPGRERGRPQALDDAEGAVPRSAADPPDGAAVHPHRGPRARPAGDRPDAPGSVSPSVPRSRSRSSPAARRWRC